MQPLDPRDLPIHHQPPFRLSTWGKDQLEGPLPSGLAPLPLPSRPEPGVLLFSWRPPDLSDSAAPSPGTWLLADSSGWLCECVDSSTALTLARLESVFPGAPRALREGTALEPMRNLVYEWTRPHWQPSGGKRKPSTPPADLSDLLDDGPSSEGPDLSDLT